MGYKDLMESYHMETLGQEEAQPLCESYKDVYELQYIKHFENIGLDRHDTLVIEAIKEMILKIDSVDDHNTLMIETIKKVILKKLHKYLHNQKIC